MKEGIDKSDINSNISLTTSDFSPKGYSKIAFENFKRSKEEDELFKCDFIGCNKIFNRKGNLKTHQSIHSESAKFMCHFEGCGNFYYNKCRLNVHMRTHVI
jgi:uncharacterized Zn-finger protein